MPRPVLLTCGHAANSTDYANRPACAICGVVKLASAVPDLAGRLAMCVYADNVKPSAFYLAFFRYRPDRDNDEFYCGCFGWE